MRPYGAAVSLAVGLVCVAGALTWASVFDRRDLDFTGTVYDAATKQPLEGAYVIASYIFIRSGLAGSARFCSHARGMTTGKDGRFRFPIEKLDGGSPWEVHAVLADYYLKEEERPLPAEWNARDPAMYRNRDIYLARQDPKNPSARYYHAPPCERPEFKKPEDGNALADFNSRVSAETEKYFRGKRR